ncbi:MAG: tRNA preQ1(34) S-adenosylmethionine ribosyltransferase-isomerase QueA [Spirochaetes bacterium]|nr:tRNA preQ1(34) S-adenosylmethionine ribosyltransferase-isomerase QueA [Spirochaetota bacterium]
MRQTHFTLDDFNFELPPGLIAQHPENSRDESRLFVLNRATGEHSHSTFSRLTDFLKSDDLLVFNDARVISARIQCTKETGASLELLLTRKLDERRWTGITNRAKRCRPGESLYPVKDGGIAFKIIKRDGDVFELETNIPLDDSLLDRIGDIALPPYIKRIVSESDRERYQTVYARESGAVAAPTAGLHFSRRLLQSITDMGVRTAFVTLHVSWGTFQPVRESDITRHRMHSEKYMLGEPTAELINRTRRSNNRIIAVGTTALRVLETTFHNGVNAPGAGETDIFIYPPKKPRSVDCMITNFHTPRSTLLMLVAAFAGYETIMSAYREAVEMKYRFFSYGDSMFII